MSRLAVVSWLLLPVIVAGSGCNAIMNGWLDPTVVGDFSRNVTMEIRSSLTLEDTPVGIPGAVLPSQEDLELIVREYPISPGDTLSIEIYELRERQQPYELQTPVTSTGYVNIPVMGRIRASGLTVPDFEEKLSNRLTELGLLVDPDVTVNALFLQKETYSIFGIGVSAANDAPLRAGTFPIRRPDLRVLDAINQVGGLNEFVTDVYIFRYDDRVTGGVPPEPEDVPGRQGEQETPPVEPEAAPVGGGSEKAPTPAEQDLLDVLEPQEAPGDEPAEPPEGDEVPEGLDPESPASHLYINGEWVPNPAYKGPAHPSAPRPGPEALDTAIPAVNWARIAGESSYRVIRVPAEMLRTGDPEWNIYVRAGDVIRIVSGEIGAYYVMGQVNRVGAFSFNAEPITLKAAIASAGGLSSLAWPDRCTVYRRLGQREQMIQVDLDRIFAGKDPDFFIKRGDIINVGTHPFAPFLQRIRALSLPNPTSNVGYSFLYARNYADIDSFAVRTNPHNEPDRFPRLLP